MIQKLTRQHHVFPIESRNAFQASDKARISKMHALTLNLIELIASKDTPKKLYTKQIDLTGSISRCTLCNSATNPKHFRNLFFAKNKTILANAERIYGEKLPQNDSLPYLICAPCNEE